jgi:hypothetical protein
VASWTLLEEQVVRISARAVSFTVVCNACAQSIASEGYGAATVQGSLPLDRQRGWMTCPRGHQLRVERDLH